MASRGARFGVLIGCVFWVLPLAALFLAKGRTDLLLPVALPMLLASLALGLLAGVLLLTLGGRMAPAAMRLPLVLGTVAVLCGLLLLLADGFVVPVLQADRELAAAVRKAGGILELPRWLACAFLVAGSGALGPAIRRLDRQPV